MKPFSSTRGIFLLSIFLILADASVAQITSSQDGAWTTGSTWVGGTAPGTTNLSTSVAINHSVTLNNDLTLSGSSSLTITINSGGTLTISPSSFTLTGGWSSAKSLTIIVKSGGTLKINGAGTNTLKAFGYLTVESGGSLSASGTTDFINDGYLTVQSGATSVSFSTLQIDYNGTGGSTATASISSGATVSTNSLNVGNNSKAILNNSGTLNVNGNVDTYGVINNSGLMSTTGTFTAENSGSQLTTNTGTLNVTGNVYAYGVIQLTPGSAANSEMVVVGSLYVTANQNMRVGTGSTCTSSTYYADLVVQTDVNLTGSGDIKVYSNGRMVVFGNMNGSTSSGTLVNVNCGGQVYVNGNIDLGTGGGNTVTNSNSASSPTGSDGSPIIGLYVNGATTAQNLSGSTGTKSQLQSNDQPFYNYISGLTSSPLPITLEFFNVSKIDSENISLIWATSSELNFDHFEVEKSTDGKYFYTIGQIPGNGTSNQQHTYEFEDTNPLIGKNYYRLKSVDYDGYTEIFKTIAADFSTEKRISVYPNPVTDQNLNIALNFKTENATRISISDLFGYEKFSAIAYDAKNRITLSLEPGIYLLTVTNGALKLVSRLVVK